jgi:1-acyl-sn-glycerol-3-phosphate acyltransferase
VISRAWLLPVIYRLSRWSVGIFYHASIDGERPAATGPVLFVANHPNSGFDPAFVASCAGRPVRFLAKAPLFGQPVLGRLLRACGAIPVYRRQDDPGLMDRNVGMLAAAQEALVAGDAVGIFPEGISHSDPSLAPLRTGAARIALGAVQACGGGFPIVPVGLVLQQKERFRSRALALIGAPLGWTDLTEKGIEDAYAVRELTARIENALRQVTLNLERWEDAAVASLAEAVYSSEFPASGGRSERHRREAAFADVLVGLRRTDPRRLKDLLSSLRQFEEFLSALNTGPSDLDRQARPRTALAWSARQLALLLVGAPLALLGHLAFFVPYQVTDRIGSADHLERNVRSTYKLLAGAAVYATWIALLATAAAILLGPWLAPLVLVALPVLGFVTLVVRERWREDRTRVQRYLRFRRKGDARGALLIMRLELAQRLETLRFTHTG